MFTNEYLRHYRKNINTAFPVVLGQVGHMFTSIADTIMVGGIGSIFLAASGFANTIFFFFFLFGVGAAIGLTALVGKANGEKNFSKCKKIFSNGFVFNISLGVILTILTFSFSFIFPYLRQAPEVIKLAKPYFNILLISILPYMVFLHFKQFIEAFDKTKPAMWISISCNILNVILNYLLINGKFGFPKMGLNGAGIATVISRIAMMISMIIYVYSSSQFKKYINYNLISFEKIKKIIRVSFPIAFQFIMEAGLFTVGSLFIGAINPLALSANQIAIQVVGFMYMAATGIGESATIRISNFLGEKKYRSIQIAGRSSIAMVVGVMFITSFIFFIYSYDIAFLFNNEIETIEIASRLIIISSLFLILDATQVVIQGALRGLQDVKIPTYIIFITYWIITLPVCYYFAFELKMGAEGVWYGYTVGLFIATILLYYRYEEKVYSLNNSFKKVRSVKVYNKLDKKKCS